MMRTIGIGIVASIALLASGCEHRVASTPAPTAAPVVAPPFVAPPVVAPPMGTPVVAPPVVAPPGTESVKAEAGVTGKGTTYGGGIVTEPVRQYFRVQERVVFEIQIPQALNLYKAANDRLPATHDEFWKEIIVANSLEGKMPKLPMGHKYVWDPNVGELMVTRPVMQ